DGERVHLEELRDALEQLAVAEALHVEPGDAAGQQQPRLQVSQVRDLALVEEIAAEVNDAKARPLRIGGDHQRAGLRPSRRASLLELHAPVSRNRQEAVKAVAR